MPESTDNTADAKATTDNTGQAVQNAGNQNQDAEVLRLRDLESQVAKFAEIEKTNKALDQQLRAAQAEALRWSTSYRSLQANTTSSLQEAARLRQATAEQAKVLDELTASRQELAQMREGLSFLASKMGDEDTAREFAIRQRETQARLAEEQARARIAQLQQAATAQPAQYQETQTQTPFVDLDAQKRQFVQYYFPNSGIDYTDPRLDWGDGAASTPEAFRRFTMSVEKIQGDRQTNQGQQPLSETETLLARIQKEREELEKARVNVSEEVREQARREVEERLRRTGADAGNAGGREEGVRRAATRLNEIDESKLMASHDPAVNKRAAKNFEDELRGVRQQLLSQYQR